MAGGRGFDAGKQARRGTVLPENMDRTREFYLHALANLSPRVTVNAGEQGFGVSPPGLAGMRVSRGRLLPVDVRWNENTKTWEVTDDTGAALPIGGVTPPYDDRGLWGGLRSSPGMITFVDGTNGVDAAGRGMFARPWKTLNYALSNTANGDQINILPGVYDESLSYHDQNRSWVGVGAFGDVVIGGSYDNVVSLSGVAWAGESTFHNLVFFSSKAGGNALKFESTYRTMNSLSFNECSLFAGAGGLAVESEMGSLGAAGSREAIVIFERCLFAGDIHVFRDPIVDASFFMFSFLGCMPYFAQARLVVDDRSTHADGIVRIGDGSFFRGPTGFEDGILITAANSAQCMNLGAGPTCRSNYVSLNAATDPVVLGFAEEILIENTSGGPLTLASPLAGGWYDGQEIELICISELSIANHLQVVIPAGLNVRLRNDVPMTLCRRVSPGVSDCVAVVRLRWDAGYPPSGMWIELWREEAREPVYGEGTVPGGGPAPTVDFDRSPNHSFTLDGDCAFTLSGMRAGEVCRLVLTQDGFGGHAATFSTPILWEGGHTPVGTLTAGAVDVYVFWSDGTSVYGGALLDMKLDVA